MRIPRSLAPARHALGRYLLGIIAIALGVALGYGVHVINRAALDELERALAVLSGEADLIVRGPRAGFDEQWYPKIARMPGVAAASPALELDVRIKGIVEPVKLMALDALRAAAIQPQLVGELRDDTDTLALLAPDNIFLSAPLAARLAGQDEVSIQVGIEEMMFRIAGTLGADSGNRTLAVIDIAGAQDRLGWGGRIHRIDLRLRSGVDAERFAAELGARLPEGITVGAPAERARVSARLSRAYRVNLDVLALVALFTGGLLVFSMQALAIVRRRSELAFLRVVGMRRGELIRALLLEGGVLGAIGGALGLLLGYALAFAVGRWVGADLGAGFFRGTTATPSMAPVAAAVFFGLGVLTAILGTWLPAREVAHATPAQAIRAGDEERVYSRVGRWGPGLALIAVGGMLTRMPPIGELPVIGYVSIACILLGTIACMPALGRAIAVALPLPAYVPARLALLQLRGAPGQMVVSLASIVAAVSLAVSMAIMVTSFRDSLVQWLERLLPAELYLRAGAVSDTAFLSPDDQARIASIDGVTRAEFLRLQRVSLDASRPEVILLARDIDPRQPGERLPLVDFLRDPPPDVVPVWVSEQIEGIYGYAIGARFRLPLPNAKPESGVDVVVAGIWRDYGRQQGTIVIARDRYVALTGDRNANDAALWIAPGAASRVRAGLGEIGTFGTAMEILTPGEIRSLSLQAFDRTFAVTYGLEAAAVVIGLAGLSASFGALVIARRRELGMLRHLGMTRRQIAAMLALQGVAVSSLAIIVGNACGWLISLILVHVVNRQSFHWSMDLHLPWLGLAGFAAALLVLAVATVNLAGRRALSIDAVRAVKDDW